MNSISSVSPKIHRAEVAAKILGGIGMITLIATIIIFGLTISDKVNPRVLGACFASTCGLGLIQGGILVYQKGIAKKLQLDLHEVYKKDSFHELLVEPMLLRLLPKKIK
jgi:hypothetical protein